MRPPRAWPPREAGLTTAREGVGYTEIRAPYGGVVTKRLVRGRRDGEPRHAADDRSVAAVPAGQHRRPAEHRHAGPQAQAGAVYVGDRRIEATKITIFPEAASPSSTFRARLDLPPGALDLAPGMYVKVGLVIGEADRLLVPASAVVERSEVTGVYVIDPHGAVSLRYVRPGHRFGDQIEILAGLAAGERIALDPIAASRAHRRRQGLGS